jgi:hypothetical protein
VSISPTPRDIQEDTRQDRVLREAEEFLRKSSRLREVTALKTTSKTLTGRINPTAISKKHLRKKDRTIRDRVKPESKGYTAIAGIDEDEIHRRKSAGECLRCAWPTGRKGTHRVKDCRRPIKLDQGTAGFSKVKNNWKTKQDQQRSSIQEESSGSTSSSETSDDSL